MIFTVPGEPVPKKRPRTVTNPRGETRTYTPAETKAAETAIGYAARAVFPEPTSEPCQAHVDFYCRRKGRGDVDNLLKTVLDALNGIVWADDKQVIYLSAAVFDESDEPRTVINAGPVPERALAARRKQ